MGNLADFPALRNFVFQPSTNWQGLFQDWFSPHITFGFNIADKPVETKILDTVGSYGSQINRIMDAVSVLVSRVDRNELTPNELYAISKFNELALMADKLATEYSGKPNNEEVTLTEVNRWLEAIKDFKQSNPLAYAHVASLVRELGEKQEGVPR